MTTIAQWLREGADPAARRDAEVLIAHALGVTRAYLYAHGDDTVDASRDARIRKLFDANRRGVPVAYLVGRREFWNLSLAVSPAVLIPRPETELLVELALERLPRGAHVLDLGTGSGAIALAIKRERDDCNVVATDVSDTALAVARENAARLGLSIEVHGGDWYAALDDAKRTSEPDREDTAGAHRGASERESSRSFDVIVSNPPYIAAGDPHLESLVSEPSLALIGGADGLDALRTIIAGAPTRLASGGTLLVEHGHDQGSAVRDLFSAAGFGAIATRRDGAGHERVTLGTR